MARILGIEWDPEHLRVVEATSRGGKVEVRRAFVWTEPVHPNAAQADEAGKRLRERLREAGVAPAPVLFLVGRERLLIREVRYPDVPAAEVPAVVHFQAAKELNFPADEAVIDFALNSVPGPLGEKRALAVVLRKELLSAIQQTCKLAGLRLEAVAARPFALLANWNATHPQHAADGQIHGLLHLDGARRELCVVRNKELLFSRALSLDAEPLTAGAWLNELRRTLAAYAAQFPSHPLQALHLSGSVAARLKEGVRAMVTAPVDVYDQAPGMLAETPREERAGFAGGLGVVQAHGRRLPIDFLHPKQAQTKDTTKRWYGIAAAVAAVLLVAGAFTAHRLAVSSRTSRIDELQQENARLVKQVGAFGDVDKRIEKINEWAGGEMVILDELYDLAAHFPDQPGIKITKLSWAPLTEPGRLTPQPAKPGAAAVKPVAKPVEKPVGLLSIEATADSSGLERLRHALEQGRHWKLDTWDTTSTSGQARGTLKVFRRKPGDYQVSLASPGAAASEGRGRREERGGRP